MAHIVPVERALRARADALKNAGGYGQSMLPDGTWAWDARVLADGSPATPEAESLERAPSPAKLLAAEFRALADELHHW